jgi:hypothetical protein
MTPQVLEIHKVKPKPYKQLEHEENPRPKDAIFKSRGDIKIKTPKLTTNRRVLKIDHANIEPSVAIKLVISEMPMRDVDLAKECGVVLEELLQAVERGQDKFVVMDKFEPLPVENWITRQREHEVKSALEAERDRVEKFKKRNEFNKSKIIKKLGDLKWQDRYRKKIEKITKEVRQRQNPNVQGKLGDKEHLKEMEKYYKEQKGKVKEHKRRMKAMETELNKSLTSKNKQRELERENEFREFNLQEVKKQQQQFRKVEKFYRNMSAASLRASDYKLQQKELAPIKMANVKEFKELRQKLEQRKEEREKLTAEIMKSELYKEFLGRRGKQMKIVYEIYLRQENYELRNEEDPDLLPHIGVQHFCKDFKIVPFVISPEEETKLFKRFSIQKKLATENGEPGLDYRQFELFLVEIACRKTKLFSQVFDQRVATLKDWHLRQEKREAYEKKMHEIKLKTEEQEKRKLAKMTGKSLTDVKDKPVQENPAERAKSAKIKADMKEKKRIAEEEYVKKVSQSPVRFMDGLIAYLEVPDIKAGITETIQRNQSAKSIPRRKILKGRPI